MQNNRRIMQNRQGIKYDVRLRLSGRVFVCFLACLIPAVLPWVMRLLRLPFGTVNVLVADFFVLGISLPMVALSALATIFVTGPMEVKVGAFFLTLCRDPERLPSPLSVCDCFGPGYMRLVSAMFQRSLRILLWTVAPMLVAALIPGAWEVVEVAGMEVIRVGDFVYIFVLLSAVLSILRELAYRMVPYLLADHPEMTPGEALQESLRITRGRIGELFLLELSFFGWLLLTSVTLLIGAVYAYPYIEGTMAAYYIAFTRPRPGEEALSHADR